MFRQDIAVGCSSQYVLCNKARRSRAWRKLAGFGIIPNYGREAPRLLTPRCGAQDRPRSAKEEGLIG
jgi:hypothetical protein